MLDAIAAAASAVAFVTPVLEEFGKAGAKRVGEGAADGVLGWLRTKTSGPSREALDDLEAAPESTDNQADLRKSLAKLLAREPALLDELRTLLSTQVRGDTLAQNVQGDNATGVMNYGSGNTTTINR